MSEAATCPRCGGPFECGAKDARCDCFDLKLDPSTRQRIAREFSGCLCLKCLAAVNAEQAAGAGDAALSGPSSPL